MEQSPSRLMLKQPGFFKSAPEEDRPELESLLSIRLSEVTKRRNSEDNNE